MHKGGKEKMGEMVIRISFFLLPSCRPSHLLTSYLHFTLAFVCNQTAKNKEEAGAIDWYLHLTTI